MFDDYGLLPPGIHAATLAEIRARFCWTECRKSLLAGLEAWLTEWRAINAPDYDVLIDGSFVRGKDNPSDVDIVLMLPAGIDYVQAILFAFTCQQQRAAMKERYHVEAMVWYEQAPLDITAFFAYIGEKAATELDLDPRHPKGYLRLMP